MAKGYQGNKERLEESFIDDAVKAELLK